MKFRAIENLDFSSLLRRSFEMTNEIKKPKKNERKNRTQLAQTIKRRI